MSLKATHTPPAAARGAGGQHNPRCLLAAGRSGSCMAPGGSCITPGGSCTVPARSRAQPELTPRAHGCWGPQLGRGTEGGVFFFFSSSALTSSVLEGRILEDYVFWKHLPGECIPGYLSGRQPLAGLRGKKTQKSAEPMSHEPCSSSPSQHRPRVWC